MLCNLYASRKSWLVRGFLLAVIGVAMALPVKAAVAPPEKETRLSPFGATSGGKRLSPYVNQASARTAIPRSRAVTANRGSYRPSAVSGSVAPRPYENSANRTVAAGVPNVGRQPRAATNKKSVPLAAGLMAPRVAVDAEAGADGEIAGAESTIRISSPLDIPGSAQFSRPTMILDDPPPTPRQRSVGTEWIGSRVDGSGPPQPRPNTPGPATAEVGVGGQVTVHWQDLSTNETGFIIEGQIQNGSSWGPGGTYTVGAGREQVLITIVTGVHRFRVIAVNGSRQSQPGSWSTPVEVEEPSEPDPIPEAPTNPIAEDTGTGSVNFRWTDASAIETGFEIERNPAFANTPLRTVAANVVIFNDVTGVGTYQYRVRAFNVAGRSAYSGWATVVIADTPPSAPTSLVVTDMGNERDFRLVWNDNSNNEDSFLIQRETQIGSQWGSPVALTAAANAVSLVNPAGPGTFRFRIAASNGAGASPYTAWVNGTVTESTGWTEFTPSADTRIVYVSSTLGNDVNNGLSEAAPKRTIAAGYALLRHGYPDWLLLKRGDTWINEPLGHWRKSGRSETEPMVVNAYGPVSEARPFLQTGTQGVFYRQGGGGSPASIDFVRFVSLRCRAHARAADTGSSGFSWLEAGNDVLIEDCSFEEYKGGIVIQGGTGVIRNVRVRRCTVVDSYSSNSHSQGLYFSKASGVLIEECLVDHNGWREGVAEATIFNHNLYLQPNCEDVIVRRNLIARASSHGAQLRGGGDADGNVFVRNPISLLLGTGGADGGGSDPTFPLECNGSYNVILEGTNINPANARGTGIEVLFASSGDIHHNIIANMADGGSPRPIHLDGSQGDGNRNVILHHNLIYNWGGSVIFRGDTTTLQDIQFVDNIVQSTSPSSPLIDHVITSSVGEVQHARNRFYSSASANSWMRIGSSSYNFSGWRSAVNDVGSTAEQLSFPGANRSVATYAASLGIEGTFDAFMLRARQLRKGAWAEEYSASALASYIRAGFGVPDP